MTFVKIRLVDPKGRRYAVEIDSDLEVETVKAQLVQKLDMPAGRRYALQLIDSFSLSPGDEIRLVETEDQGVRHLEPLDD
jgi:hypothetical protein